MTNEAISLIPSGKLRCVISGKLRKDTPEENVRQRIARSLLDNYGYDKADIEIEFTINQASKKVRVDVAIFPPETKHKQENIKIIIECKKEEIKPTDRDRRV
ncbi:MAG: type I restriction enzyme HsdR N-terminal domain-containing protein [Microcystaceae cyanobacterium]